MIVKGRKASFKLAGGSTDQTSSSKEKTAGQIRINANRQIRMILTLKVAPGWVSVLKLMRSFWTQKEDIFIAPSSPSYCLGEHVKVAENPLSVEVLTSTEEFWIKKEEGSRSS